MEKSNVKNREIHRVSFEAPKDLWKKIVARAATSRLSKSDVIRMAIEKDFAQ